MAKITDVTQEYADRAMPGNGTIAYEAGYRRQAHEDEIRTAKWLIETFGGDVILLKENTKYYGIRTPDYLWKGATWELKGISSDKFDTIDKRIRKAYEQIRERAMWSKRGGIVLDFTGSSLPVERIGNYVAKSAGMRAHGVVDIIVKKGSEYIVLRTQKE